MSPQYKNTTLKLERFMPYRLSILSNKVSSIIAATYKDKFALSVTEWRIMAILGEHPNISADEICTKTQIEKSIISRSVNGLLKRNLIERSISETDRRRSIIKLSQTGQAVYEEIVPLSYKYQETLMQCFSSEEIEIFSELLDRLHQHASTIE